MLTRVPDGIESEFRGAGRVVVIFENAAARELAIRELSEHLPIESHLENHWWSFSALRDSHVADEACGRAAAADLVVFALTPAGDLPNEIKWWVERCLAKRGDREGVIVGLVHCCRSPGEVACLKEVYLRQVAHRAGLDYLSQLPPTLPQTMPESWEPYRQRAGEVTSVLDEILHTCSPPRLSR